MTQDRWGSWTFSKNVSSLSLMHWEWRSVEDSFSKDDWVSEWINYEAGSLLNFQLKIVLLPNLRWSKSWITRPTTLNVLFLVLCQRKPRENKVWCNWNAKFANAGTKLGIVEIELHGAELYSLKTSKELGFLRTALIFQERAKFQGAPFNNRDLTHATVMHPKLALRSSHSGYSPLKSETGWTGELWSNRVLLML